MFRIIVIFVISSGILLCQEPPKPDKTSQVQKKKFALVGGTVLPVTSAPIENGIVLVENGVIKAIGKVSDVQIPDGFERIDTAGKFVMPGIIDSHSHMGVYSWPSVPANSDGNEAVDPITPNMRVEDAINTEDPAFKRAVAGGVTSCLIIPGSANMIGGLGMVIKLKIGKRIAEMEYKKAKRSMKMASGENPKRVYGERNQLPSTRMGNFAIMRDYFQKAKEYKQKWLAYEEKKLKGEDVQPPEFDPKLDALKEVLDGNVLVQVHCYRADEILTLLSISNEFGFKIRGLHHCLDGYKVAEQIARYGCAVATFSDWWGYKVEAWDAIPQAPAILASKGVRVAMHSDSPDMVQRLYHEAAKCVKYGMAEDEALKTITIHPAWMLGIDSYTGSLEVGKDADIAIFSKHPFDIYTLCEMTFIEGEIVFDRKKNPDYWGDIMGNQK